MSHKKEEKAIPVSLWDDARLRPWTIDKGLDAQISDANNSLQDMIQATSGSKISGKSLFKHFMHFIVGRLRCISRGYFATVLAQRSGRYSRILLAGLHWY